jgi:uncharacterized MnhB-related membrane protein
VKKMALPVEIHLVLLMVLFIFMIMAVEYADLLRASISLAAGSMVLGLIFYGFEAPFAGIIEVSVGAGLITVLLMATISIVGDGKEDDSNGS